MDEKQQDEKKNCGLNYTTSENKLKKPVLHGGGCGRGDGGMVQRCLRVGFDIAEPHIMLASVCCKC